MKSVKLALTALLATTSLNVTAAKPSRWFEVEVILFTRDIPEDAIREEFVQTVEPIRYHRNRDLLTPYHYPDIKPLMQVVDLCDIEQQLLTPAATPIIDAPPPSRMTQVIDDTTGLIQNVYDLSGIGDIGGMPEFSLPDFSQFKAKPRKSCIGDDPWTFRFAHQDRYDNRHLAFNYDMYPRVIKAGEQYNNLRVHLMSNRNFRLRDIYRTLRRQPDMRPILHTAWRQPAGAKKRMRATRLYAGIDYSQDYDFQGRALDKDDETVSITPTIAPAITTAKTPAEGVVDNIERLLSMVDQGAKINYQTQSIEPQTPTDETDDPTEVREIDGLFKIHVDAFNYLHIDAEFNIRREGAVDVQPVSTTIDTLLEPEDVFSNQAAQPTLKLNNYHFKQTRRVITKELHYFDHPYMGMIVLIRRWGW